MTGKQKPSSKPFIYQSRTEFIMAKLSSINKNERRKKLAVRYADKRSSLKKQINDKTISVDERMQLQFQLQKLPKNSAPERYRNRCGLTGRPRGVWSKFQLCRVLIRDLGSRGLIPGLVKASW
jgi:small subunit ribosomal protein S14